MKFRDVWFMFGLKAVVGEWLDRDIGVVPVCKCVVLGVRRSGFVFIIGLVGPG